MTTHRVETHLGRRITDWETCDLQPDWVDYWRNLIRIMRNNGIVETSLAIFKVNQPRKTMTVITQFDGYTGSKEETLNQRCVEALGWEIIPLN